MFFKGFFGSFTLQYVCVCVLSHILIFCDPKDWGPPSSSVHADSPGKNTAVGSHFFPQGISLTQGSNLSPILVGGSSVTVESPRKPCQNGGYLLTCRFLGSLPDLLNGALWVEAQESASWQLFRGSW